MLQRRLEKEFALFGGAPPVAEGEGDENENDEGEASQEEDEGSEPDAPISGIFKNPVMHARHYILSAVEAPG